MHEHKKSFSIILYLCFLYCTIYCDRNIYFGPRYAKLRKSRVDCIMLLIWENTIFLSTKFWLGYWDTSLYLLLKLKSCAHHYLSLEFLERIIPSKVLFSPMLLCPGLAIWFKVFISPTCDSIALFKNPFSTTLFFKKVIGLCSKN